MKRFIISTSFLATPSAALAHGGHIAASGGHTHYLGLGAAIVALALVVGGVVKIWRKRNV